MEIMFSLKTYIKYMHSKLVYNRIVKALKEKVTQKHLHLQEMSNVRKKVTGLPVNIWVDEAETYKKGKHVKRIKFQLNTDLNFKEPTCPRLLDGTIPDKIWKQIKDDIDPSIVKAVQIFVQNNSYALDKLADQLIWKEDFLEFVIKGCAPATNNQKTILKNNIDMAIEIKKTES